MTAMGETAQQRIWRERVEGLIALAAPALELLLNTGERVSRVLYPEDTDYYPIRPAGETFELDAERRDAERRAGQPVD